MVTVLCPTIAARDDSYIKRERERGKKGGLQATLQTISICFTNVSLTIIPCHE